MVGTPDITVTFEGDTWCIRIGGVLSDVHSHALDEALDEAIAWGGADVRVEIRADAELAPLVRQALADAEVALKQFGRRLLVVRDV